MQRVGAWAFRGKSGCSTKPRGRGRLARRARERVSGPNTAARQRLWAPADAAGSGALFPGTDGISG